MQILPNIYLADGFSWARRKNTLAGGRRVR